MAGEKVAKAYLSRDSGEPPDRTHKTLVHFMRYAAINNRIRRTLDYENKKAAFREYVLGGLLPLTEQLQALSPEGDDHPNPEYPWRDAKNEIQVPHADDFGELNLDRNPQAKRLADFLQRCADADF